MGQGLAAAILALSLLGACIKIMALLAWAGQYLARGSDLEALLDRRFGLQLRHFGLLSHNPPGKERGPDDRGGGQACLTARTRTLHPRKGEGAPIKPLSSRDKSPKAAQSPNYARKSARCYQPL